MTRLVPLLLLAACASPDVVAERRAVDAIRAGSEKCGGVVLTCLMMLAEMEAEDR